MSTPLETSNIWVASCLLSQGLPFVGAHMVPGPPPRAVFVLSDPHGAAERLIHQFLNETTRRIIRARGVMADVLDVTRARGSCDPGDVPKSRLFANPPSPPRSGEWEPSAKEGSSSDERHAG